MKLSKNSYVGILRSIARSDLSNVEEEARVLRWCGDIQGQTITHMQRLMTEAAIHRESTEFEEEHHNELLEFLGGVGRVVTEMANEIRDPQDLETHS